MARPDGIEWRQSTGHLVAAVIAGAVTFLFLPLIAWPVLSGVTILGFGLDFLLASLVAPVAVLVLLFWFADRQDAIDSRLGDFED